MDARGDGASPAPAVTSVTVQVVRVDDRGGDGRLEASQMLAFVESATGSTRRAIDRLKAAVDAQLEEAAE